LFLDCGIDVGLRLAERLRRVVDGYRFHYEDRVYCVGVSMGLVEKALRRFNSGAIRPPWGAAMPRYGPVPTGGVAGIVPL